MKHRHEEPQRLQALKFAKMTRVLSEAADRNAGFRLGPGRIRVRNQALAANIHDLSNDKHVK